MEATLRLGDLLERGAPAPWVGVALLVGFGALVLMNGWNLARAFRAAPTGLVSRIGVLLSSGRLRELRQLCEADTHTVCQSVRIGLTSHETANARVVDRAAMLSAWRALAERYEWWPKLFVAFGFAVGITGFALVMLHAGRFVVEISNRLAGAWVEPPVRGVLRSFAEAVIVTGSLTALVFAGSVIAGLSFLFAVRAARQRTTRRLVASLGIQKRHA